MKTYQVKLAVFENGETNPEVLDLVNVLDENDRIMANPDDFFVGEIITEEDFFVESCSYVDEYCYGSGYFAFKNPVKPKQ